MKKRKHERTEVEAAAWLRGLIAAGEFSTMRAEKGLTFADITFETRIPYQSIRQWQKGQWNPAPRPAVEKLARLLGWTPESGA